MKGVKEGLWREPFELTLKRQVAIYEEKYNEQII